MYICVCPRFMGHGLVTIPDYETWKPQRKLYESSFKRRYIQSVAKNLSKRCFCFICINGKCMMMLTYQLHEVYNIHFIIIFIGVKNNIHMHVLAIIYLSDIK